VYLNSPLSHLSVFFYFGELPLHFFSSFCGLRQREPQSLLLFAIVMEALGKTIYVVVSGELVWLFCGDWE
jgi:hypothetical protein